MSAWTSAQVDEASGPWVSPIDPAALAEISPDLDYWDFWPLETLDGQVADVGLWFALAAPCGIDPAQRHAGARIRLLRRDADGWRDLGPALPDGLSPGSREWSGSAILDGDDATLFFTAAGERGESRPSFSQRLFLTTGVLTADGIGGWTAPREIVASDADLYERPGGSDGAPGQIKAFRDPAWFRDPADGGEYLLFAASLGRTFEAVNGAVGLARREVGGWALQPPLLTAEGVSNELERPHVRMFAGLYYLFWSTRREVFAPGGPAGPTGLYGMVADAVAGPWRPLNGSGLVIANPRAAPAQAYGWWVLGDGRVVSATEHPGGADAPFRGLLAPELRLELAGDISRIATSAGSR